MTTVSVPVLSAISINMLSRFTFAIVEKTASKFCVFRPFALRVCNRRSRVVTFDTVAAWDIRVSRTVFNVFNKKKGYRRLKASFTTLIE